MAKKHLTETPDISVIILNYNTRDLTRVCLAALHATNTGPYRMEIILCDNGSQDGSIEMVRKEFPGVVIIDNKKNLGFAAGNNPGIRRAAGRYVLLLNSDTEVPLTALADMIAFMDRYPAAGAGTAALLLPDGSMDPACHRGFPTPWVSFTYLSGLEKLFSASRLFGEYHQGYKRLSEVHEVDCISGAFFMVRREVVERVGLLDEEYFMYGEDIDWAFRIRKAGWKILFNPHVTVLHKKKQSGRSHVSRSRRIQGEIYFHTYNWLFYRKNYAKHYGPILTGAVNAAYSLRLFFLRRLGV